MCCLKIWVGSWRLLERWGVGFVHATRRCGMSHVSVVMVSSIGCCHAMACMSSGCHPTAVGDDVYGGVQIFDIICATTWRAGDVAPICLLLGPRRHLATSPPIYLVLGPRRHLATSPLMCLMLGPRSHPSLRAGAPLHVPSDDRPKTLQSP